MSTPQDLMIVSMDVASSPPVEPGDLSLALAGAEVIDLLGARAVTLEGDRLVPVDGPVTGDHLLDQAASALADEAPYESVEDWLWRRGRNLSSVYRAGLQATGLTAVNSPRWRPWVTGEPVLLDSPAREGALARWTSGEPVLSALAAAAGISGERGEGAQSAGEVTDDAVAAVLAAVHDAVEELQSVRQRKDVEQAAFDNIWRA
ncbi:GPP34 family phosphoprotein [Actinacidiphila glaucinigra]|uniref:GOLPH3/VPS74 family protein n=1 Tax=Actinacidiphila glaucinigra TaxID=235986 RepID=UPI002DD81B37|nr:GPP34 family phosphoprotein [Actinacidiphila glaucinigra]WSD58078.1 GPP34 family phosphoprotein [Actinacidiphila glaucinigra]